MQMKRMIPVGIILHGPHLFLAKSREKRFCLPVRHAPARELLEVLEPPFRIAYPVAPAVTGDEEAIVSAGVLQTPEELEAYRARFADVEGEADLDHQAHAVDAVGQHWTLMAGAEPGEVLALCFGRDEAGVPFSEQTAFTAESMPLPVTVVELD